MAIIGKIREKSALLVVIIGLALLAFILGGYKNSSFGTEAGMGYGTVYGEDVDAASLQSDIDKFIMSDQNEFQKQQREYTAKDRDQSEDKAWNYRVETTILEKEFEALGIDVQQAEFDAYLYGKDGFTVMPDLAEGFKDPATGQFNPTLLQKQIEKLQASKVAEEQKSWAESKEYYINKRKQEKYYALLAQGVYVTKLEAEQDYQAKEEKKSISYVVRHYTEIQDDKIKVTDEALRAYYEEHKTDKKYENRASNREIKFFDVAIQPSSADSSAHDTLMKINKSKLMNSKSLKEDSLLVIANSEFKGFSSKHQATYRPAGGPKAGGLTYPAELDTVFKTASIGQVVGPYTDNGSTRVAKILDFNTKLCKVRHILISAPKGDDKKIAAAQKKADSLIGLLNKDNFEEFVMKFSEDPGSKDKGGVYEDFLDHEMVPEFSKFSTDQPVGAIGSVKTDFGIHIIEVLDRKAVKYPILAVIQKTLEPTIETTQGIEEDVYKLLYKLDAKIAKIEDPKKKIEMFDTIVSKAKYMSRPMTIQNNKPSLYGFQTSFAEDKILRMAYDEESVVGTLCASPIKDKNRYIIAILSSIRLKGVPAFEDVQVQMKSDFIKEKKAEKLMAQMVKKSLKECAKKGNTQVAETEVTFATTSLQGAGNEPEVVGAIFSGMKDGATSIPLKGESGVYVIRLNKTIKAKPAVSFEIERKALLASAKGNVSGMARAALMKKADVIDNRRFLKAGIQFDHE